VPNWDSFWQQLLKSVKEFIFHSSYLFFIQHTWNNWSFTTIIFIFLLAFAGFVFIFLKFPGKQVLNQNTSVSFGWVAILLLAIALPVLLVESTTAAWFPGTRSLMLQQVWQPILYVSLIFLLVNKLPLKQRQTWAVVFVALLGAIITVIGLSYNQHLVLSTQYQRALVHSVQKLHILNANPYFIVKNIDSGDNSLKGRINSISNLVGANGKTMFQRKDVSLRVISDFPYPNTPEAKNWKVKFDSDEKGVVGAAFRAVAAVPYKQIFIIFFDGKKAWLPNVVTKQDLGSLQVLWNRRTPIYQTENRLCNEFNFDREPPLGDGWSGPEKNDHGNFMWMAAKKASMTLENFCQGPLSIKLYIGSAMSTDILNSLRLKVQDQEVPLVTQSENNQIILTGKINLLEARPLELVFTTSSTVIPSGGDRTLAIMFNRVKISRD
jgi:hypothetical protein